jgi:hypothetical protein
LKLGVNMVQNFGSGGSPSAAVQVLTTGLSFTTSATWTRYSGVITLPSVAGKTFGTTAGTDNTSLQFWLSSGATNNAAAGNIGVQTTGTVQLWGVQLEIVQPGQTVPTKLEKRDPVLELQQCQRFFQVGQFQFGSNQSAGNTMFASMLPPVTLRSTSVTFAITAGTNQNCGVTSLTYNGYAISATALVTATAPTVINSVYTVSADL